MQSNIYRFSKLPLSKNKIIALFIFVAVMIFTVSALHTSLSKNNPRLTWESAETVAPQSLLKQVLSQKSTRPTDISSIKVMRISSQGAGNLYIFDYDSPQLCGVGGCLYSVYDIHGKAVLEFIANPYLPPKEKLVQVSETVNQGFPCLNITQSTDTDKLLSQTEFCYQKGKYIRLNNNFIQAR
ncbi:MAG: histidine kinase [Richelia sp. RM2_1_2]|nr:histidine kinase [Richelia sp. RM1_1_1]NJO62925.1 histidine kinase [Richelia sp. RM2_1_2]